MFQLDRIKSTVKKKKRVGRGGSRGGTSGKGHKGQKARSGGSVPARFEGGQMPLHRRLPKRGSTVVNRFKKNRLAVSVVRLGHFFEDGSVITRQDLLDKKIIKPKRGRSFIVKVLAGKEIEKKLTVHADEFSKEAVRMIEGAGGKAIVDNKVV